MQLDKCPFTHPWDEKIIHDLADVIVGGTPRTSESRFWGGEIPWMSSGDIHLKRISDVPGRITDTGLKFSNAKLIEPPAVAVALAGQGKTRGTAAITLAPVCTNQSVALIKPRDEQLGADYLFHALDFRYEELRARSDGAGRAGLTKSLLETIPIPLPDRAEQSKIAKVLSTVDLAIAQTEALIAKHKRIRTGLMHDLLTRGIDKYSQLRDPATHKFKSSLLGLIPEKWECVRSESICKEICVGIVIRPAQYYRPSGVPTLRSANVHEEGITTNDLVFISEETNRILVKSRLREGYVVSVRTGYPGTSAVVPKELDGVNCIDLVISKPGIRVMPHYLALWINSPFGRDQVLRVQGGLAQQHFNVSEMKKLQILLPDLGEQQRILEILAAQEKVTRTEEIHLQKLQRLKTGLMQDLLTGKVSVAPLLQGD